MEAIRIIENRSEIGAGTRGSSLGVDAVKLASLKARSDYFKKYSISSIKDQNHLLFEENQTPNAIHIEGISKVYDSISKEVSKTILEGDFPIVLAADHASAGGTIAGIKESFPSKRLGVIWIDAHADLHSPFTSPSGNVHGMPLASALGIDNDENAVNQPNDLEIELWEKLKTLGGSCPKIEPKDLVFFGVRDTEGPEDRLMERLGVKNFTVEECRSKEIFNACSEALSLLNHCDIIYISFDVDSMDPDMVSYGTGTPVKNGFSPEEAQAIIENLVSNTDKLVCFEMVEVNPILDDKVNKMAETAFNILEKTTEIILEK